MTTAADTPHSLSFIDESGKEQTVLWDDEITANDNEICIEDAYITNYDGDDELHFIVDNFKYSIDDIENEIIFSSITFTSEEGCVIAKLIETDNFATKEIQFETFWERVDVTQELPNTSEQAPVKEEVVDENKQDNSSKIKEDFKNQYFKIGDDWYYPLNYIEKISSTPDAKEFEEKKLDVSQQHIKYMEKQIEKTKTKIKINSLDSLER